MDSTATKTNTSAPLVAASPLAGLPDCDRVNIVLDQLLEGRHLTAEDEHYLVQHGEDCSPCFDDLKKQQLFIGFLADKIGRRPAPSALPQSIMARLHAEIA